MRRSHIELQVAILEAIIHHADKMWKIMQLTGINASTIKEDIIDLQEKGFINQAGKKFFITNTGRQLYKDFVDAYQRLQGEPNKKGLPIFLRNVPNT